MSELPGNLWRFAYAKIADRSIRQSLSAERRSHRILFDHISRTLVRVSLDEYEMLRKLQGVPKVQTSRIELDRQILKCLVDLGLVFEEDHAFCLHRYNHVSIELNSHCNFRCVFCPVAENPHPKQVMPPDLIERVLDRVVEYGAKSINLNHYGEPTLSSDLISTVRLASNRGIDTFLYTNASGLTAKMSRELANIGKVVVLVNLPTIDPEEFRQVTRSKRLDKVLEHVRAAVDVGLPVYLSINTPSATTHRERKSIRKKLMSATGTKAYISRVISRAGSLTNTDYASSPDHEGPLSGCLSYLQTLVVSVNGDAFLCCNDYQKEYVLGNLCQSSIKQIAESPRAVQLRRFIFGADEPPENFICRSCEETQPRDTRLWVGPAVDGDILDPKITSLRRSVLARRLMARFPVRFGDTVSQPQAGRPHLSPPGLRFR